MLWVKERKLVPAGHYKPNLQLYRLRLPNHGQYEQHVWRRLLQYDQLFTAVWKLTTTILNVEAHLGQIKLQKPTARLLQCAIFFLFPLPASVARNVDSRELVECENNIRLNLKVPGHGRLSFRLKVIRVKVEQEKLLYFIRVGSALRFLFNSSLSRS